MTENYEEKFGNGVNGIKKEARRVEAEVRERIVSYIIGGLGVVVGLSWNEAIKGIIEYFYPLTSANSIFAKLLYAVVITVIVVLVTIYILRPPEEK